MTPADDTSPDSNRPPAANPVAASLRVGATGKRSTNNLVTFGSAAVLAIYSAGFLRTRAAASQFDDGPATRRRHEPVAESEIARQPLQPIQVDTVRPAKPSDRKAATGPDSAQSDARALAHSGTAKRTAKTTPTPTSTPSAAPAAAPAPAATASVTPSPVGVPTDSAASQAATDHGLKDGTYAGWGSSRHGDIQAAVEIKNGRIVSATITQCLTRYSCSWIAALPKQVVDRQSAEVDYISGATQSTNAFYGAVVEALSKAK